MLVSGGKIIAIDNIKTNSATLSGDGIWSELGLNTSAVIDPINNNISSLLYDVNTISSDLEDDYLKLLETSGKLDTEIQERKDDINALSSTISAEIETRIEADEYLNYEINTKQHILSAGDNILITSGDDYDIISVTGLKTTTYFSGGFNKHIYGEYFALEGNRLSANSAVGYFNLCIGYQINTNGTNVDNYYSACVKVNDEIVDTHYINGGIPSENHYISKNVLNDSEDNLYTITIENDNKINISDMNITCVGYIGETDPISLGVLGTNGNILTFGNTILRV